MHCIQRPNIQQLFRFSVFSVFGEKIPDMKGLLLFVYFHFRLKCVFFITIIKIWVAAKYKSLLDKMALVKKKTFTSQISI